MALTGLSVTLNNVNTIRDGLYEASVHLVVEDDEAGWDGIDEVVSHRWNQGTNINLWRDAVGNKCQAIIDRYKDEKQKSQAAAVATAITQIQNNLEL